nr:MAG TPA: hypothetical protein [Caudoviricetes sp.]
METIRYITREEMNTNLYQLFHRSFLVRVTYIDLMDTEEVKLFGTRTSGDEQDDICNANEKVVVSLTIPNLLKLFRSKIPFYLFNKSEEHHMYSLIATHLKEWREYAQSSLNLKAIPMEDLNDLSEMAKLIYQNRDREKDTLDEDIKSIRNSFTSGQIGNMLSIEDILVKEPEKPKEQKAPHLQEVSVLDEIFSSRNRF